MSQWWRDAVIYQVYPRSFADTNGDGIGDLAGIRDRMGYLSQLGIDAIWLSPFYTSPMKDGGYDVADFRDVDPMFGTLADFDALVAAAHAKGIKVIVDIVPNHSSSDHAWFSAALAAGPGSPERARYHFRDGTDGPPNNWQSYFGGGAWRRLPDGQWYLHMFDDSQPDLNWDNPEVRDYFLGTLRFWLDRGADGFRVDVAHGLVKAPGLPDAEEEAAPSESAPAPYRDQDGVHEIYRDWRRVLDSYDGDRMAVAEAWVDSPEHRSRYVRADELHQAFNFDLLQAGFSATDFRKVIDAELATSGTVGAPATWVLSNHDRKRHATRYGGGAVGLDRARAASLLMLALPGSSYLYQGEELGLFEYEDLPDSARQDPVWERSGHTDPGRDGCRVPLPWKATGPSLGFGSAPGWLPQPAGFAELSVETQDGTPGSTLGLYRAALRLRRRHRPATLTWNPPAGPDVLSFANGALTCVTNFGTTPVAVDGEVLLSSRPLADGRLPANATAWLSA
ncbi:MAG TPA: glycoside hydrolase family 13 protein [Stackebrandtia sp.]|jgi:alpha-glucosidase|uniref:glycoside hydrolase family 13 protein n=1 Tax=Stackebrandtia sp. TaxID=2023065 RepID=UPI002D2DD424|nr:glycoside hydrolase family 13 protein [Stackebrandtia sp.]HZE37924.1 glycoside hydrolase family 13 protein [Stackebrandtia sp.]